MCAQNSTTDKWKKLQLIGPDRQFSLAPRSSEPWTDPAPQEEVGREDSQGGKNQKPKQECQGLEETRGIF